MECRDMLFNFRVWKEFCSLPSVEDDNLSGFTFFLTEYGFLEFTPTRFRQRIISKEGIDLLEPCPCHRMARNSNVLKRFRQPEEGAA